MGGRWVNSAWLVLLLAAPAAAEAPAGVADAAKASTAATDTAATTAKTKAPIVSAIRFTGATSVKMEKLNSLLQTRPGQAFDAAAFERDIQVIEAFYHHEGYPLAFVGSECGIDAAGVVTIPIIEGQIERILIKGNKKTRPRVIRRELDLRPGAVYAARTLTQDRERLYKLGLFNSVSISPQAGSTPGKTVLTVDVNERESGSALAALGFTSSSGLVGYAHWSDGNFMGMGQTLSLNWQRGAYGSLFNLNNGGYDIDARAGYDIGYYSPWVFRHGLSAGVRYYDMASQHFYYFNDDVDEDNIKNYEWRRGQWLTLARIMGSGATLGILGRNDTVDFDEAPSDLVPPAGEVVAPTKVRSIRLNLIRGPLNPFSAQQDIPYNGLFLEMGHATVLDASNVYQKLGLNTTRYFAMGKKNTLATRLQLGLSAGNVPYAELYAVGGPQTVRSYSWNKFLGTRMLVLNTELRHKLQNGLTGAAFVDCGYAWGRNESFRLGDLAPAVGLGLHFVTPFGPIRLDYAIGRDGGRMHLTTGDSF